MYKIIGYDGFCVDFNPIRIDGYVEAAKLCRELEHKGFVVFLSCGKRSCRFI